MTDFDSYSWRPTTAPQASSRYDDIWFFNENIGWGVNSSGMVVRTDNGGESWVTQATFPGLYLRCIGFADDKIGWIGTSAATSPNDRILKTSDGGSTWHSITTLPSDAPKRICGLWVIDKNTVIACGSNLPEDPTAIIKTVDGGLTWTALSMKTQASSLIDIYFLDSKIGFATGGIDSVNCGGRPVQKPDLIPVLLRTADGGTTWTNLISQPDVVKLFPRGEWGWKIQYIAPSTILVSLQNYRDGAILRSDDDGKTWSRLRINDRQRNSNLEGIGFLDGKNGWVGGWGDLSYKSGFTSVTSDGGTNWDADSAILFRINRFRFVGSPIKVGYAAGHTIYKFSDKGTNASRRNAARVAGNELQYNVPKGTKSLSISIFEPASGVLIREILKENGPEATQRQLCWDLRDAKGAPVPSGIYILRVCMDAHSESFSIGIPLNTDQAFPISFVTDIRPLFRDSDIEAMKTFGNFDLSLYRDVVAHADAIYSRLLSGDMPCDGAWPQSNIQLFQKWIQDGKQP